MKNAISILQEYAAKYNLVVPLYEFGNKTSSMGSKFNCHCRFEGKCVVGTSTTKKEAKLEAARKILELLSISYYERNQPLPISSPEKSKFSNPVGTLNEYLIKNGYAYAAYQECGTVHGLFLIRCQHLHHVTEGTGPNKKTAKFNAAVKMLETLNIWKKSEEEPEELIEVCTSSASMSPVPFVTEIDYVSRLNELCLKNFISLPKYFEKEVVNGLFTMKVICKSHEASGRGYNKKFAKQNAADRMLQLLEAMKDSRVEKEQFPENENVILEFNKRTKVHKENLRKPPTLEVEVKNESTISLNSEEKLKILQDRNVKFQLTELQKDPYVYSLSLTSTQIPTVFMEIDDDRDKVVDKILSKALENLKII